jgi:aminoglycoside phosphotransferase (APT) family kinase protein
VTAGVLPALAATARRAVHRATAPCACPEPDTVLADRDGAMVVRHGEVVAKAHATGTDAAQLSLRLALAAHPALDGILLSPLSPQATSVDGRPVTLWPHGSPVDPAAPEHAPWEEAGTLLARLHQVDTAALTFRLPPMRGPVKAALAIARLRAAAPHPGAVPVLRAWAALPAWARAEVPQPPGRQLCHGDLHLGQLVRLPSGAWRLIDVDDMGIGVPAWDLARPAASFACGLLGAAEWTRFLDAYRASGGPAVPVAADPWPALDVPARALSVQVAALSIAKAQAAGRPLDETEQALIDACARMADVPLAREAPDQTVPAQPAALPEEGGRNAAT